MRTTRSHSKLSGKGWVILALLVAVIVCGIPLQAKKKPSANAPADTGPKRVVFDITKIVWPSPPAIARVRFQAVLTGQRIDWAGLTSTQKPKQSWMDRLAGEQPDRQVKDVQKKVGFQLMRVSAWPRTRKGISMPRIREWAPFSSSRNPTRSRCN